MKIQKVRQVKTPSRGTPTSAGIDFFVPDDFMETLLTQGQSTLIPSGIIAEIPKGYALIAFNKSGIATKQGLQIGACVVDEDYRLEIHLHVMKVSQGPTKIVPGQKLVQFILVPVFYDSIEEVDIVETNTDRIGGFGSTGLF